MGEVGEEVLLYVYDLTGGMAQVLGQSLLRKLQSARLVLYHIILCMHTLVIIYRKAN